MAVKTIVLPAAEVPVAEFDVAVAGGGTGGVVAALASARRGAKTVLIEMKGYLGGLVTEGGTALHSFYNNWKTFPGREKVQIVRGIPQEIIDRLMEKGGCTGHAEMVKRFEYDSVCTAVDVEIYKAVVMEMLLEAGVTLYLNTAVSSAVAKDGVLEGVVVTNHEGRTFVRAKSFVDCTGYGDLCGFAGASYTEPNDHSVCNSMGVGGVSMDALYAYLKSLDAVSDLSFGVRDGEPDKVVRLDAVRGKLPEGFAREARELGMATAITTTHNDYFMFVKLNYKLPESPTARDAATAGEIETRRRQQKAIELLRKYIPGCENAFIARTSPSLCIRRARCILCDYDVTIEDITGGKHFEDDILVYGFHDEAPRYHVNRGGTYGIPYRAMLPRDLKNVYATGMMITTDWHAHMSTRNTVSCMGQGQAAGTAAALCAAKGCASRELPYAELKQALLADGVYLTPMA